MKNIKKILLNIGVPPHLLGFRYIEECVKIMEETDNPTCIHIVDSVYEECANRVGSTGIRVERAIRHAVEYVFDYVDPEFLQELFGRSISSFRGKATNRQFLSTVYLMAKEEI